MIGPVGSSWRNKRNKRAEMWVKKTRNQLMRMEKRKRQVVKTKEDTKSLLWIKIETTYKISTQ